MSGERGVAILVPTYRDVPAMSLGSLLETAVVWTRDYSAKHGPLGHMIHVGHPVDLVRNALARAAVLKEHGGKPYRVPDFDVLVWWDSDVQCPPITILRLVKALRAAPDDVAAVAAVVPVRGRGAVPQPNFQPLPGIDAQQALAAYRDGMLVEVAACGFGLVATRPSVFKAMAYPWFQFVMDDGHGNPVGEDYGWCHAARAAGFRILIHPGAKAYHEIARPVAFGDASPWAAFEEGDPDAQDPVV